MELIRKKMRLEVKTTYNNNSVIEPLIVMSLFEDGEFYEHENVYNDILDSKDVFVNQCFRFNLKKEWYYSIKKINSVNTFIEFSGYAIRDPKTILNTVYNVIMSIEQRD